MTIPTELQDALDIHPEIVCGTVRFKGTHVPVQALIDTLDDGDVARLTLTNHIGATAYRTSGGGIIRVPSRSVNYGYNRGDDHRDMKVRGLFPVAGTMLFGVVVALVCVHYILPDYDPVLKALPIVTFLIVFPVLYLAAKRKP